MNRGRVEEAAPTELHVSRCATTVSGWDDLVRAQPDWTHFHLFEWRRVIERVFGHECPYLAAHDGRGRLMGVLPLVRVKSALFGHYLVSVPFFNYGGPLGTSEAVRALAHHAADLARDEGADLLELRSREILDVDLPVSRRKVTVLLDLPPDPDTLWQQFKPKVRSQVRRPQKEGVMVRFGPDQVKPFFHVFSRHMRDLGTPTQPLRLFQTLADTFADSVWFGCAYLLGRPIACGCGFRWGDEFEMTWASALRAYNRVAPNMLLYWSFMERCVADGVRTFNFGRCTPGEGTHRFKLQWDGARDVPLHWYYRSSGSRASTPSPDDKAYAWGPRLWRNLPLGVANAIGPRIVRNIP